MTKLEGITEETKVEVTVKANNGIGEFKQTFEVTLTVPADDTAPTPQSLSTDSDLEVNDAETEQPKINNNLDSDTNSETDTDVNEDNNTDTSTEPTTEVNEDTSTEANTDTNEATDTEPATNTPADNKTNEADTKSTPEVAPSKTYSEVTDKEDTQANQEDSQNPAESEQSSQNKEETSENNSNEN